MGQEVSSTYWYLKFCFIGEKIFYVNAQCQQGTIYMDTFHAVVHVPEFGKMNEQDDWIHHA